MRFLPIATAAVLAGSATAIPTPEQGDAKPAFEISFTYVNGTFTDVFPVPDSLEVQVLNSGDPVANVFFQPPATGVFGRCTLLEPDRQGLGVIEFSKPTIRSVEPAAVIGFVQCNSE
ncbi:hypothetical protein QBC33DRAFT_158666 [Phialemonium atrogriseum]|uniref:Uncharacterized protein n=1 Tax=Phialemonium atrogriseum TaxID=1093897 RepID=A0AAJ0C7X4_9PEZI|nr:uncharacterized protein QBC33DRAFT_158666 [Phialemonium atrogriseum]KAK1771616.1 hypothetical protein QBC33DRAFT_158666 [Phialemonium atrogriseum]